MTFSDISFDKKYYLTIISLYKAIFYFKKGQNKFCPLDDIMIYCAIPNSDIYESADLISYAKKNYKESFSYIF